MQIDWKAKANCEECQLSDRPFIPPQLPRIQQYSTLWIGQEPGDTEQYTLVPFTGPAGKQHFSMMKSAGFNKLLLPHDNICSCYPPEEWTPNSGDAGCCFPRLKAVIHHVKPELIIALGDVAMQFLTGQIGIMSQRGRYFPLLEKYDYDCEVYCVLHPSYTRRQRQWIPVQIQLYKEVHVYLNEGKRPEREDPIFIYDPTAEELREILYGEDDIVDCDTETTGLNPRQDIPLGHSFSTKDNFAAATYYVQPYETDPRWQVTKEFFEDPERKKAWQNGCFDTSFCREHGIKDRGFIYDTRLAQQLLNSDLPTDLDFLRAEHTNIPPYKPPKRDMKKMASWPKEKMLEYANWDALTLREVRQVQTPLLSEGQMFVMQDLLIPLVRAIHRMESRGVLIDVERLAGLYAQVTPILEELSKPFYELGLNPRSPTQLMPFFGLKSTNEKTLESQIKRGHEKADLMQQLLKYRAFQTQASRYLKGVYKKLEAGRIHAHFKIEGTGTGRLSCEKPSLHNIPEEMRVIYVADPGYKLIKGDYSQIELWVGAILIYMWTGCDAMLRDLEDGVDVHNIACEFCFPHVERKTGNRKEDYTDRQQLIAKTVVFGTFYGRSAYSISREFGVSVADAEMWQLKLVNKYPGAAKYKVYCEDAFNRKGYLETPFGRRRYLTTITQGYNFPVQSTASDVTLRSIVLSDQAKLWNWVTVHDDIVIQVPDVLSDQSNFKEEYEQKRKFMEIMERKVPELENMSFKVGYKEGYDWYNMKRLEV